MKIKLFLFLWMLFPTVLFSDGNFSEEDKEIWKSSIKRVQMKPPCCGACKLVTQSDAKMLWEYLTSISPDTKVGKYLELWNEHKKKILAEFKTINRKRYTTLFNEGG